MSEAPRPVLVAEPAGLRCTVQWNRSAADLLPVVQFSMDPSDWTSHVPTLESIHELPSGVARLSDSPPLAFAAGFFRTLGRQPWLTADAGVMTVAMKLRNAAGLNRPGSNSASGHRQSPHLRAAMRD